MIVLGGIAPTEPMIEETVQSCRKVTEGEGVSLDLPNSSALGVSTVDLYCAYIYI
jgi:hypothetical protein